MADKKESTLRCVTVLVVIAVVCGVLLAVLNPLLYVAPTADDIAKQFDLVNLEEYNAQNGTESGWVLEELDEEKAGKVSDGAAVSLAAKLALKDEEYIGLLIKTKASGDLGECAFVMFFTKSDDKLSLAKISTDGTTAGKTYSYAQSQNATVKKFEDYYKVIDKANAFDDGYSIPVCGATKTVTAVDNAFKKAAAYYYNVYVLAGEKIEGEGA